MSTRARDSAYALLTDGTAIEIQPARPGDFDAVHGGFSFWQLRSAAERDPDRPRWVGTIAR